MKKKIVFILTLILLLIIVVLSALFFIKFYKVNKIINLMKVNSNKQNYSYKERNYINSKISFYILHYKTTVKCKEETLNHNTINYYDLKNNIIYYFDNTEKSYLIRKLVDSNKEFLEFPFYRYLTSDFSFKNKLKLVFDWKIKDIENDCYEITTKENYKVIFDKNIGIVLRVISLNQETKFDKGIEDFKENSVTEEDVKLPDLTEYTQIK